MNYNYGAQNTIKAFVNDKTVPKLDEETARKVNADLLEKCSKCKFALGRISIITYFLLNHLDIEAARTMNISAGKQRDLICALQFKLIRSKADEKWTKALNKNLASIHERCRYVFKICEENIKLTEYYPYFEEIGFDRLSRYALDVMKLKEKGDPNHFADRLMKEIEAYKAANSEKVAAYILEITPKLERMKAEKERLEALEKEEKEAERSSKRAVRNREKEIKKDTKEMDKNNRKLERSYDHLYREAKRGEIA